MKIVEYNGKRGVWFRKKGGYAFFVEEEDIKPVLFHSYDKAISSAEKRVSNNFTKMANSKKVWNEAQINSINNNTDKSSYYAERQGAKDYARTTNQYNEAVYKRDSLIRERDKKLTDIDNYLNNIKKGKK